MNKNKDRILLGCVLLIIGIYSICKAAGITFPYIAGWWWLFLIVLGLYLIFFKKRLFGGILISCIGLVFFLAERAIISSALPFPIILTIVGLLFLFVPKGDNKDK